MDAGLDRIFEPQCSAAALEQFEKLARGLNGEADPALYTLETGLKDAIRRWPRTTKALERLIRELRRRDK